MPRVGSSIIRIFGLSISHFEMTTFCWLPPLRLLTRPSSVGVRICSRLTYSWTAFASSASRTKPKRVRLLRLGSVRLVRTAWLRIRPCAFRSSGTNPMPCRMASRGDCTSTAWPSISTSPASRASAPKIARTTSVRPAPTSPARPRISPLAKFEAHVVKHDCAWVDLTARAGQPAHLQGDVLCPRLVRGGLLVEELGQ